MDARKSSAVEPEADREIVITRVFDAPRELVWAGWTDPERVVQWWGPTGFTTTIEKMDVRPGGVWKHVMHGPDGTDYPNSSVFKEVVKPERIVYSHGGGKKGGPSVHFVATWTFEAIGDKTRVTMRSVFPSAADRDIVVKVYGAIEGGKQTLERLDGHLQRMTAGTNAGKASGGPMLVVTRHFDASAERVFDAWLDPATVGRWLFATPDGQMQRVEIDARVGGKFVIAEKRGNAVAEHLGTYEIIDRPRRLVFSFADSWDHNPTRVSVEIEPAAGGCNLTLTHEMDPQWANFAEQARKGWTGILEGLARRLA
jgi:uncharacterized protein YndB with AHSA1/START domain